MDGEDPPPFGGSVGSDEMFFFCLGFAQGWFFLSPVAEGEYFWSSASTNIVSYTFYNSLLGGVSDIL